MYILGMGRSTGRSVWVKYRNSYFRRTTIAILFEKFADSVSVLMWLD